MVEKVDDLNFKKQKQFSFEDFRDTEILKEDINDTIVQYKYGSYCLSAASDLKDLNTKKKMSNYDKLPIKDKNEIAITVDEICSILGKEPDSFLKPIFEDLEILILKGIIFL